MICPTCNATLDKNQLACPSCLNLKSKRAAIDNLPSYAPDIKLNRLAMLLRRRHKNGGVEHVAVPQFHDVAFCGAELDQLNFSRRATYRELPSLTCPECERVLNRLMNPSEERKA